MLVDPQTRDEVVELIANATAKLEAIQDNKEAFALEEQRILANGSEGYRERFAAFMAGVRSLHWAIQALELARFSLESADHAYERAQVVKCGICGDQRVLEDIAPTPIVINGKRRDEVPR